MDTAMLCAVVSGPPAAPLAIAALLMCAGAAVYAWGLAVYAWSSLGAQETRRALRWGQRVLSVAALLCLAVSIATWVTTASSLSRGPSRPPAPGVTVATIGDLPASGARVPEVATELAKELDPLLARPIIGALLVGLLGLTLLRARAAYLEPASS
jgi:hypothetical protein